MDISAIDVLFYADRISGDSAYLSQDEMHHVLNVLRKRSGEEIFITDGAGMYYQGLLRQSGRREMEIEIVTSRKEDPSAFQLHIAIAPTKSFDRMEWCIEKMTEIGVNAITPLICERSERIKWNEVRVRKIAISAMKQSKRAYLPVCRSPEKFSAFVSGAAATQTRYIAVQDEQSVAPRVHYTPGSDVLILIGPEGDFTPKEVQAAIAAGFIPLSLGQYRLRTETAAVVAASIIQGLNQPIRT